MHFWLKMTIYLFGIFFTSRQSGCVPPEEERQLTVHNHHLQSHVYITPHCLFYSSDRICSNCIWANFFWTKLCIRGTCLGQLSAFKIIAIINQAMNFGAFLFLYGNLTSVCMTNNTCYEYCAHVYNSQPLALDDSPFRMTNSRFKSLPSQNAIRLEPNQCEIHCEITFRKKFVYFVRINKFFVGSIFYPPFGFVSSDLSQSMCVCLFVTFSNWSTSVQHHK